MIPGHKDLAAKTTAYTGVLMGTCFVSRMMVMVSPYTVKIMRAKMIN